MRSESPINRGQIVDAALAIVDEEGSHALSMRTVAKRVDRHVSSLYNHVTNRSELIELLSAHVVRDIDTSMFASEPWNEALKLWSRSYVSVHVKHPNLIRVLAVSPVRDLPSLQMYELILRALVSQGWPLREAIYVLRSVEAHAWGAVFDIVASSDFTLRSTLPDELSLVRAALDPDEAALNGGAAAFEVGLDALIVGFQERHVMVSKPQTGMQLPS